ncbi:protein IQ-DOMAIN 31-like [Humulus lupulus]|uniref:protein IQ-DOMAIN 31-like n=1 Tax=Humulus lupulus TaxID=3486 RepID=UPI002B415F32|nr:protein IQ-DOMAIN 31-like [Humulus lupulus]XP_062116459.1 protein IQ-DOMAIN 31-like [Humulus lupulus]XP_062116460.1 protein IQ-DOMAIN 31-like [Humulus lupulus]XP_062116461.1 protein IQ-DOMAIN 31-like [Humulus lupulus]
MGKSPGKWIKTVLFGKKSSKSHILKGREKTTNEREVVVAAKASGDEFSSVPPAISHPFASTTERIEVKSEFENREADNLSGDGGVVLLGNENAETQGSIPQEVSTDPEEIKREQAASLVQATFRGYLARRAFWALKGIIRLQALIRGHLVRRQAVATLSSMLGIVKFQALIRGRRVRSSDIGLEVHRKCSVAMPQGGKPVDPVGVNFSAQMEKLSTNAFIRKLLATSPNVMPLYVHYESGEPNSVSSWLECWSSTYFWKPLLQPKKILDSKSHKKLGNGQIAEPQASRSKRTRRPNPANVESFSAQAPSEVEKPKRNFRKVSSHAAEPVQENPQIELEKIKRNLRKVHNPIVENSVPSEAETEIAKPIIEKEITSPSHDGLEQYISNSNEKVKKETPSSEKLKKETASSEKAKKETASGEKAKKEVASGEKAKKETASSEKAKKEVASTEKAKKETTCNEKEKKETTFNEKEKKETFNLPDVEAVSEPSVTKEVFDLSSGDQPMVDAKPLMESTGKEENLPGDQATDESNVLTESTRKEENFPTENGGLSLKEDLTGGENQKSGRKTLTPAKQERVENGLQNSPALPSYMAATESAKAKLRAQGSPRIGQETTEKNSVNRRHSLPSSTNNKISSQSPRTQRLVQTGGKGGNKSDRSLPSRDGNGKVSQTEWKR